MTDSQKVQQSLDFKSWCHPVLFLASGFGVGAINKAPGTLGTIVAIPMVWLAKTTLSFSLYVLLTVAFLFLGAWLCEQAEKKLGKHDDGRIVWDEIVGLYVAMMFVPNTWLWYVLGFALFRFFDISKVWPVSYFDSKVPGGWGVMLDDVVAGGLTAISLALIAIVF